MSQSNSNNHQLLIQKLLVSVHYLTLFRDEIILVEKTTSLLGASFSPHTIQSELGEILSAVDLLSKQEKLIKSTFWYDEASFKLMNLSLDIVGTWIRGVDNILEICESKTVFQAILGDKRPRVFGVLTDVFTSLRIINLSIKEESNYFVLLDSLNLLESKKEQSKKEELLAKINVISSKENVLLADDYDNTPDLLSASRDEVIQTFRDYLINDKESLVYVVDAEDDLSLEIDFYNSFAHFNGSYGQTSASMILVERLIEELENRSLETTSSDKKQGENCDATPVYLIIYGYNQLAKDSRFNSLMSEVYYFSSHPELHG